MADAQELLLQKSHTGWGLSLGGGASRSTQMLAESWASQVTLAGTPEAPLTWAAASGQGSAPLRHSWWPLSGGDNPHHQEKQEKYFQEVLSQMPDAEYRPKEKKKKSPKKAKQWKQSKCASVKDCIKFIMVHRAASKTVWQIYMCAYGKRFEYIALLRNPVKWF